MSYVSVEVYVVENTPLETPVEGVMVRVFDDKNVQLFSQETTDSSGRAGFTLWAQKYHLRFYKYGAQIRQPQVMEVAEPAPGVNTVQSFVAKATIFKHPLSSDPRLCKASGFFRDVTGAPQRDLQIQVIGRFDPILLEGSGVLSERRTVRTDADGFACIDLIRFARYSALISGYEDQERCVEVPDLPSANLPDLLFPVVDRVTFDVAAPYKVKVGKSLVLTPVVLGSNQVPLTGTATSDVTWKSSDDSVFSVAVGPTTLTIEGRKAGMAQLTSTRLNNSIVRIPNLPIQGVPVNITVC